MLLQPARRFALAAAAAAARTPRRLASTMPAAAEEHKDGSTKWSSNDGRFRRQVSSFRDEIAPGHATFQPQKGRYFLAAAMACPWAHRCVGCGGSAVTTQRAAHLARPQRHDCAPAQGL